MDKNQRKQSLLETILNDYMNDQKKGVTRLHALLSEDILDEELIKEELDSLMITDMQIENMKKYFFKPQDAQDGGK